MQDMLFVFCVYRDVLICEYVYRVCIPTNHNWTELNIIVSHGKNKIAQVGSDPGLVCSMNAEQFEKYAVPLEDVASGPSAVLCCCWAVWDYGIWKTRNRPSQIFAPFLYSYPILKRTESSAKRVHIKVFAFWWRAYPAFGQRKGCQVCLLQNHIQQHGQEVLSWKHLLAQCGLHCSSVPTGGRFRIHDSSSSQTNRFKLSKNFSNSWGC